MLNEGNRGEWWSIIGCLARKRHIDVKMKGVEKRIRKTKDERQKKENEERKNLVEKKVMGERDRDMK